MRITIDDFVTRVQFQISDGSDSPSPNIGKTRAAVLQKRFYFRWNIYLSLTKENLRADLLSVVPHFRVVILTTGAWHALNKATVDYNAYRKRINLTLNAVASLKREVGGHRQN